MFFSGEEAELAAGIHTQLESKGRPIGPYNELIAASALAYKATLVRTLSEFCRIEQLTIKDWFQPSMPWKPTFEVW